MLFAGLRFICICLITSVISPAMSKAGHNSVPVELSSVSKTLLRQFSKAHSVNRNNCAQTMASASKLLDEEVSENLSVLDAKKNYSAIVKSMYELRQKIRSRLGELASSPSEMAAADLCVLNTRKLLRSTRAVEELIAGLIDAKSYAFVDQKDLYSVQ